MVIQFVNSFVNKPGNIGVRTGKILSRLNADGNAGICICRGVEDPQPGVDHISMGVLGHVPRMLNAIRIYLAPRFNHRSLDIALFENFAIRRLNQIEDAGLDIVAHVWDYCPNLIRRLQDKAVKVFLDIPMAPLSYVHRLHRKGRALFLNFDARLLELERQAFRMADTLIVPSAFVKKELTLSGVGENKIIVVPFGVDVPASAVAPASPQKKDGIDFCFMGNVNCRKGIQELLAAWSDDVFQNDRLHLCGRVFPEVHRYIGSATGGRVITPGFIAPSTYLRDCDVFVFPSWMEGSSKAVFEAMAHGLPVIVTHSTGSVARDGVDGFVIEAGDATALRERMLWFKKHPDRLRRMGDSARQRAKAFTWTAYAEAVIDQYSEVTR